VARFLYTPPNWALSDSLERALRELSNESKIAKFHQGIWHLQAFEVLGYFAFRKSPHVSFHSS
jgi:hypothetical protein